MNDISAQLQQQVQQAQASQKPLSITGSNSKAFYGYQAQGEEILNTLAHSGIINYEPAELILTARAGTPLAEIENTLAEHGQMLSCEAPHFGENASFGGMIAAGLSGPGRPYRSGIADLILGCTILNGKGEILKFGGQVMKNVAGYDISRLMVGSLGCLGIILEATVKVVPKPKTERSFHFDLERHKITSFVNKLNQLAYPVSATAHFNQRFLVRFSAGEEEINNLDKVLVEDFGFIDFEEELTDSCWLDIREHTNSFFKTDLNIWRISLAPGNKTLAFQKDTETDSLLEWNGALRWLKSETSAETIFNEVADLNGSATLFKKGKLAAENPNAIKSIFQPLSAPLMKWQQRLKKAFDPAGIFNPGRMYRDF